MLPCVWYSQGQGVAGSVEGQGPLRYGRDSEGCKDDTTLLLS